MTSEEEERKTTKAARLYLPEWEYLYWVSQVTGQTSAAILRQIAAADLAAMYTKHEDAIKKLKRLRQEMESEE